MSQIRLLYRLQELDNDIRAKKQRLGDVLRLQKENEALKTARDSAAAAIAERDKWQKQRRKLETEIADLERKSKVVSDRLYSGAVKNPKELSDLQHQIESMGRRPHSTLLPNHAAPTQPHKWQRYALQQRFWSAG